MTRELLEARGTLHFVHFCDRHDILQAAIAEGSCGDATAADQPYIEFAIGGSAGLADGEGGERGRAGQCGG